MTEQQPAVLYRDEWVLAIDKPAGRLSVPGRPTAEPGERALSVQVRELAEGALPVHRLDRGTSGVLLFALGREAHRALNRAFEERRAEKSYLALARGVLAAETTCELPLHEGRAGAVRVARPGERAQAALTCLRPQEKFAAFTLIDARPRTGRTHQIRVHLAALGLPLALDDRYGAPRAQQQLTAGELHPGAAGPGRVVLARTPLHAAALRVPHPRGRGWLAIESPLPADLAECLELLRAARRATGAAETGRPPTR